MDSAAFVKEIKNLPGYRDQAVHVERIGAQKARYGRLERPLPPSLERALRSLGVGRLYRHQAQVINAVRRGRHVIVATGTASGKTLAYNVPVLEAVMDDAQARALYLFPTKALAHDQLRGLRELAEQADPRLFQVKGSLGTYDGDTARTTRRRLRREANLILTNPDMLHLGILPNHSLWAQFFSSLRFVVIDESHVYRGVFGSHVACVLRRLWRICDRYGSAPQVIACTATIANPGEHLGRLAGVDAVVVGQDDEGSPHGARDFVLWNPPLVCARGKVSRRSANSEGARLFAYLVQRGIRTITFARARRVAELILLYARRILEDQAPEAAGRIRAYRAGYQPEERREIERDLRPGGRLLGVAATSALELGIDIGDLDASVIVGYPGTIASLWQQAGRAGRGVRHALSILVARDDPLDQYFMRHPHDLFGRVHEHALIDPGNPYVLQQHLPCAAHEIPLSRGDSDVAATGVRPRTEPVRQPQRAIPRRRQRGQTRPHAGRQPNRMSGGLAQRDDEALFGPGFVEAMVALEEAGTLQYRADRWYLCSDVYPAMSVSLRAMSGSRVTLLDASQGYAVLEELDSVSAPFRVHPGAIYLHQGESYRVRRLDLDEGRAILDPVQVSYYTQPQEINEVRAGRTMARKMVGGAQVSLGAVHVTQQVTGFRRVQQFRDNVLGVENVQLPAQRFDTVAMWWDIPPEVLARVQHRRLDPAGGLHALEHAAIGLLPLFALCDRWDIGGLSTVRHPDTGLAQVFIYDAFPGGVGIAEKGYELLVKLWQATYESVHDCPCDGGCPSCIQSPKCGSNNEPLDKAAAILILGELLR